MQARPSHEVSDRTTASSNPMVPRLNSVDVTCHRLGIGRTMLYRAIHPSAEYRRGLPHLKSVTMGGKRLVSDAAIEAFIAALEAQAAA